MPNLLKQRYQIVSVLGRGGMGIVYKALDTELGNRPVAIKEMQQGHNDRFAVEAFRREAEMLAHLMHPQLPSIHEHFLAYGCWFLVMEFIEGQTLETYLEARGGRLAYREVLGIGLQLCSVLDYLHTRQPAVIFRDLKPPNIMISADGHLYLIDFGIARHFKPGQSKDTSTFYSVGYAAPEQYSGSAMQTTPLSDIYGLGATFYRLLTGHEPSWNEPTPFHFPPLSLYTPGLPVELETLVMQMLEVVPDKRPASMLEVKQRLQSMVDLAILSPLPTRPAAVTVKPGEDVPAPPLPPAPVEPSPAADTRPPVEPGQYVQPPAETSQHEYPPLERLNISRRSLLTASGALLVVAAAGLIGWGATHDFAARLNGSSTSAAGTSTTPLKLTTLQMAFSAPDGAKENVLFTTSAPDGVHWSNAVPAQHLMQLQGSPTVAIFENRCYMAFRGDTASNALNITSSADGNIWSEPLVTKISLQESPSMAAFGNKLYIAFNSNDTSNTLSIVSSADGKNWPTATPINYQLDGSPAMAVFRNKLYIVFKRADGSSAAYLTSSTDGVNWSAETTFGLVLQENPSMVVFHNRLYIAISAFDGSHTLCVTSSADGENWSTVIKFGVFFQGSPSMAVFENRLYVTFKSVDGSNSLCVTSSSNGEDWSTVTVFGAGLQDNPTIAVL